MKKLLLALLLLAFPAQAIEVTCSATGGADKIFFYDDSAQDCQELEPGTDLSISGTDLNFDNSSGYITGVVWGDITGTLSNQTDVQSALNLKLNTSDFTSTADSWLGTKDTDDLSEGSGNLYYTNERAQDAIGGILSSNFSYDDATPGIDLSTTGVSANTYGDATHVGVFTVDAYGRITSASESTVQHHTTGASITAAGSDITDATQLTGTAIPVVFVITTSSSGSGVKLPSGSTTAGYKTVSNQTANDVFVYPPNGSSTINGQSGGTPYLLRSGAIAVFFSSSTTAYYTSGYLLDHNILSNLQGGTTDEYYHATAAEYAVLQATSGTNTGDVTVSDSAEIDHTLTGQDLSSSIVSASIDESKLDTSVNASLDLADSSIQPGDNVSDLTNDAGYLTGNETITLSGDVTGSGATAITTTVTEGGVTQHEAALSITESQISDLGSYLENIVEDTSPQLGGDLASNGSDIIMADNDKAIFGTGSDGTIYYNGTDLIIDPSEVGSGALLVGPTADKDLRVNRMGVGGSAIGATTVIVGNVTSSTVRQVLDFAVEYDGGGSGMTAATISAKHSGTNVGLAIVNGLVVKAESNKTASSVSLITGADIQFGLNSSINLSAGTHTFTGVKISNSLGSGGTATGGTVIAYGLKQEAMGTFTGTTQTTWGGHFADRLYSATGLVVDGDFGSGLSGAVTFTDDIAGSPSDDTTPVAYLKIYGGTATYYLNLYQ